MKLVKLIEFLRKHLRTVVKISLFILLLLIVIDAIPGLVGKEHHAHTKPEFIPGFWSIFGFVACVLIIFLSKWYGHAGIMTREDYYDE
jgi:phage-related holin